MFRTFLRSFSLCSIGVILMVFVLAAGAYADQVAVTNPVNNLGEEFVVGVMEEGGIFWHDREYTMTGIPEEYLGLTKIMSSADSLGTLDYQWMFEIDRSAHVYIAFDSRFARPEDRTQNPENWFNDAFDDTGQVLFLDAPHPSVVEYWIYRSKEAYPTGQVTIFGIDETRPGDPIAVWVFFVEEAGAAALSPSGKLAATWAEIKSPR